MKKNLISFCTVMVLVLFSGIIEGSEGFYTSLQTSLGYSSNDKGFSAFLGGGLHWSGNNLDLGLFTSAEIPLTESAAVYTVGLDGKWSFERGTLYYSEIGSNLYARFLDKQAALNSSLRARLRLGTRLAEFRVGHVQRGFAISPWDRDDLIRSKNSDRAYHYIEGRIMLVVNSSWMMRWSQYGLWQRFDGSDTMGVLLTTGPDFPIGEGYISLQAGVLSDFARTVPIVRLSHDLSSPWHDENRRELQLAIETRTWGGGGPVFIGTWNYETDQWRMQAMTRIEWDNIKKPELYFSFHPFFL